MRLERHSWFHHETGTNTKMTRLRAAVRRPAAQGQAPFGTGNPDLHRRLRCHGLTAPFVVDAPMNRRIFETYVTTQLPRRSKRATSSFSTTSPPIKPCAEKAVRARGAWLLFLPPYSPDLNPSKWHSPSSAHLRKRQSEPSRPLAIGDICQLSHPPMPKLLQDHRI